MYIFTLELRKPIMTTFIGDYTCKADTKGRITLPAAFKRQLSSESESRFVVKKDIFENCLILYPFDEWQRQVEILRSKINPYKKEHNKFVREFYKGTAEMVLDSSNRVLVPKRLLDLIGTSNEFVLAGQDGKIEIWNNKAYDEIGNEQDDFAMLAEKIMGDTLE